MQAFPGIEMPVDEVVRSLREMWRAEGEGAPSEFRASQMNLVVHFGLETTRAEALAKFDAAISFAQKYPCRLIILCPGEREDQDTVFHGKLFTQCYIGETHREMCCCEALILEYSPRESAYLSDQVSVWLEGDLPVYHWMHRVPAKRVNEHYLEMVKRFNRVIIDSSVDGALKAGVAWPEGVTVGDLAQARNLPLRQSIGQFLSSFSPEDLINGLSTVTVRYAEGKLGEAENLLGWLKGCVAECKSRCALAVNYRYELEPVETGEQETIQVEWSYCNAHYFDWQFTSATKSCSIAADFGHGRISYPIQVNPLSPADTLSEALFF